MRILSFDILKCNIYLKDGIASYIDIANSSFNILANLNKYFNTYFIGNYSDDIFGNISLKYFKELNIPYKLNSLSSKTNLSFIDNNKKSEICPYCKRLCSREVKIDEKEIINEIKKDDYLIIDNLKQETINIISQLDNEMFLYLEHYDDIESLSLKEICSMIANKFKIIFLKDEVYYYLKDKFLIDSYDLYEMFNPNIFVILRNIRGCDVIYQSEFLKKIFEPINIVDLNGSESALISEFIRTYIEEKNITNKMISKCLIRGQLSFNMCSKGIGSLNNIMKPYKIKEYDLCICSNITVDK